MFPCLAGRPWHVLCRVSLQHKAPLSQRSPRIPQLCHGESRNVIFVCNSGGYFSAEGSTVIHCVSQDGRVEVYTAGGLASRSAVSRLRRWARSSTTLPPEAIKMPLRNHHPVVLHRLNRSYQPPPKVPHLQQATHAEDLLLT